MTSKCLVGETDHFCLIVHLNLLVSTAAKLGTQPSQSQKRKKESSSSESDNGQDSDSQCPASRTESAASTSSTESGATGSDISASAASNDLGLFVGRAFQLSIEMKKDLLKNVWVPQEKYDFANDAIQMRRKFNFEWLNQYSPWLVYSKRMKGALCKFCVLFPPMPGTYRGVIGSFIIKPFSKFQTIHEHCKKHMESYFHKTSTAAAMAIYNIPVDVQIQQSHNKIIDENKKVIASIISCVVFCATHDMPLRGKKADSGIFFDLLSFRIASGDRTLENHLEKCKRNAAYTSPYIQNEIINICGDIVIENIITDAKSAQFYAILADESADISGKEQLSIGLRFYDEAKCNLREEFVGFVELQSQTAASIAATIDSFMTMHQLPPENCVGLGFDGCSTMSGK